MTKALGKGKKARSFSGCKCCKQAKRKCPEERPQCSICEKLGLKCEYDLNFLFRCEMVDFSGHISKAARITRPAPQRSQRRSISPALDHPPSPQKYIEYEFIDESASIMSPAGTFSERSPTPISSPPISPMNLLLEAANANNDILTPPQSPDNWNFNHADVDKAERRPERQCLPASLKFILN